MLSLQEQRILGELTDTTFGRSSIRDAGHAIAYKSYSTGSYGTGDDRNDMEGMILEIRFETIVNINPVEGVQSERKKLDDQSIKSINEAMKQLKTDFKAEAGNALKIKEHQAPDSFLEVISFNPSLLRGKYYRTIKYLVSN